MQDIPVATELALTPLPIDENHWRSRWLQLDDNGLMHRVSRIEWQDNEMIAGEGVTICGWRGHLHMPGILARMYGDRCPACCKALGIAPGQGAPYNEDIPEP
jgi:hypothetical protein